MRYLKTLLVSLLALVGTSAFAQTWTGNEAAAGTFYLYNVGTGKWLCGANNWGTHASVGDYGVDVTLAGSNGSYTIDTQISNSISGTNIGGSHFLNGEWCDGGSMNWTFTQVKTEDGAIAYTIGNGQHFLTANTGNTLVNLKENEGALSQWILVSKADIAQVALDAKATDVVDVTGFIIGQRAGRNNTRAYVYGDRQFNSNNGVWVREADADGRWCNFAMNSAGGTGSTAQPYAIEAWNWKSFNFYQDITEVPNGKYTLHVNSFYRGYDGIRGYVYANDAMSPLTAETQDYKSYGAGSDLQNAAAAFFDGKYDNSVDVTVTNGSIRVGVKQMDAPGGDWMPFANFRLEYKGMASLLKNAIDKANELMPTLNETNAAELQKAIDAAQAVYDNAGSTNAEIEAAMEALQDAYNTADAENIAKKKAIEVLNNVPYVLFPKDFKWALEDGEKYDKLTGEQKMDLDRDFKVYKNNNGKYQLASRVAVLALVKLLEYADADEKTKKAIKARMDELGIEGYDEMLADAITTYTRLVVETHGVGAALGEQGDPNYSRMYAALEEAGEDPDVFIDALVYGATRTVLEDPDPYWGGGTISGNSWTSDDGLVTITNVNNPIQSSNYYDYYWDIQKGEDWKIKINSDDENINLSRMYLDSGGAKVTVKSGSNVTELDLDGWTYYRAPLSGKEATIHIDDVYYSPDDFYAGLYMYVYVEESYDPWVEAGVERTTSDVYELLHQYLGGYSYGFDANFTAHIKDPNLTEGGDAWESTWGGILNNEPLTDSEGNTEYPYFDANTWNESGTMEVDAHQTIQLPPGRYMLTAAGRASQNSLKETKSSHAGLDIVSTIWEGPFTEPGAQDPANYFQLYATTFEGKTVAKSFFELEGNKGGIFDNGWNDASVFFTMPSVGDVTIGVRAATNVKERWASATRFRLTRLGDATVYLNEDETLTDELNWDVVGYNLGAYTPSDFLLKKEMQAGKWYSIAVPCDIPWDQIIREFGEGTLLAQPLGVLDLDEEGKQKLLGFLEWDPYETYAMYGMGGDHVYGNAVDGILANTPYLIKPATVKASNRYLFKDVFAVEKKSVEKSEWSWGAVSVSDVDNDWGFWSSDYGPIKFYPNYTYKPGYADGYTVEVCDTVKAYTGLFEVEGDAEIGTILMLTLDEEYNLYLADDAYDIPFQQILDLVALGQQKAEMYPGIPAAMANKLTTVPELDDYVTTLISAINSLKTAITEAQKAYEPSKKFNALMKSAEELLASDHTELVAGADAAFKKKIETLQRTFDRQLTAEPINGLIEQLEAAIAEYKEQIFVAGTLEDGNYYIMNVGTGKYLNGGNSWGTRASLTDNREYFTTAKLEDGAYTLESRFSNGGEQYYLGPNYYVDNGNPMPLTITAISEKAFTISCTGESGFGYLGWDGSESTEVRVLADADSENAQWVFVSVDDVIADIPNATVEEPKDATPLIKDAYFGRNHRDVAAWEGDGFSTNSSGNTVAEKWGGNSQTFDIHQTVTVPDGVYRLSFYGYYRYNNTEENTTQVAIDSHKDGTEVLNSFVYANDVEVALKSIADDKAVEVLGESNLPFSMDAAGQAFAQGLYKHEILVKVEGGKLVLGIKKINHPGCDWTVWDDFILTYYGDTTIEDVQKAYPAETGATTGINEVNTGVNTGAIYNLNGVRVNNMTKKGVYIVNGKKIVVK